MKDWKQKAVVLAKEGYSWRKIAASLDIPKSTCSDYLRKVFKEVVADKKKPTRTFSVRRDDETQDNSRILLISDMHIPYHHPNLLDFLESLKKKYKPTRVICLGDEMDKHALSYHDSDPDLPSAGDELRKGLPIMKELQGMFPKMDIIESNHGSLVCLCLTPH